MPEKKIKNILWIFLSIALTIGFFLPDPFNLFFWLPGGTATVLIGSIVLMQFIRKKGAIIKISAIPRENKEEIKKTLDSMEDLDEKKDLYINMIKKHKDFYNKLHKKTVKINSSFIYTVLLSAFVINFIILSVMAMQSNVIDNYISSSFQPLDKLYSSVGITVDEMISTVYRFSPTIVFFQNLITLFFLFFLMRKIFAHTKKKEILLGKISYFKMPENVIWFFILSAGSLTVFNLLKIETQLNVIIENVTAILLIFYLLQGLGTFRIFLQIRFLPFNWIFLAVFMSGLIWPGFFMFFVFLLTILGLGDFWFLFRKRALQPRLDLSSNF
ncbi:MAG: YybS family protein [Spirochaetia bacterium]|nr:YybS family protein [Spirochaetia bacterium]